MAARPCVVTPMKAWGFDAERMASIATPVLPSVPFLNPMGKEEPLASSRCSWDSVVRAPMAPQETRSLIGKGEISQVLVKTIYKHTARN